MSRIARLLVVVVALPGLASCAGVLGIDKADLESTGDTGGSTSSGGATASSGGAKGSGGKEAVEAGPVDLCHAYCASVAKNCTGDNEIYTSLEMCLAVCDKFDPGTAGDVTGNTVNCRMHYAESAGALGEKGANCSAAGPGGDGVCGGNCLGFCTITQGACTGSNQSYATKAACELACAPLPTEAGTPLSTNYNDSIETGNSIQCRLYHSTAATIDPVFHCPHTVVGQPGPCAAVATPATP